MRQPTIQIFPMMRNCVILLLSAVIVVIVKSDDAITPLRAVSAEIMETGDDDLEQAESKDASATEIIKQIRKVNADGTLTIGYEADDGTFKIEKRDPQGNVKMGTFGYVDDRGEVKRISYTTENNTLARSSEIDDDFNLASSSRYNRTYQFTTRRPASLAYLTSTSTPSTTPTNIQNIPRRKFTSTSTVEKTSSVSRGQNNEIPTGTTTVVYATSVATPKPFLARSVTSPNYSSKISAAPDRVEINQVERKVFISSPKESSSPTTLKPVSSKTSDESENRLEVVKIGNGLRRQLKVQSPDDEAIETQQQVLYGGRGDESSAVYGNGFGNVRPLFTTTSQPRVPLQVLAARQRATQLQNTLSAGSSTASPPTTTDRIVKTTKRQHLAKQKPVEEVTENLNENILNQPPLQPVATVASGTEASDDRRAFQRPIPPHLENLYRSRNYQRQVLQQQELQQQQPLDPRLQFRLAGDPNDIRQSQLAPSPAAPAAQRFAQQYQPAQSAESFQSPLFPPRNAYDLDRPLTVRDFERLLQVLVLRNNPQNSYRINPFYPPSNPLSYPPFIPGYNQQQGNLFSQIPRPPFFNPVQSGLYDPGYQNPYYSQSSPVSQQYPQGTIAPAEAAFQQQQQNPQQQQSLLDPNFDVQRNTVPRRRQYDPRLFVQQSTQVPTSLSPSEQEISYNSLQSPTADGFLPPSVRENLLYRMLMLAIRNDQQISPTSAASSTGPHSIVEPEQQEANVIPTRTPAVSRKPVRSVQILGEETA